MNNFDAYFFDLNNLFKPSFSMPTSIEYNIKDSGFLLSQSNPLGLKILNEPQHQTINFQISDNDINLIDMAQYQHVNINGLSSVNNPGFPNLPFQSYEISIPDNAEFLNISIVQGDYMEISLSKDIIPSPQEDISKYLDLPRNVIDAIQDKYGRPGELRKNEIIYNSSDYFPNRLFSASSGYNKDHEKIISISFYPVQYNPIEKKLIVIKNAQIKVMYGSARETPSNLKTSEINIQSSNGYLWYSDVGNDNIYKIDASGNIQSNFNGPSVPNGLAFDGTYLWISSLVMGYIYKYNTNGDQISYFWPGITTHDLAWANGYLWVIGNNDRIYKMDTNGNTITSFYPPSSDCRGITFDGTYLWLSDLDDKTTYKVDTSGNLISTFNNPGNYPWGLAWSGSSLWLVDLINSVDVFVELTTSGTLLSQINSPTGNPVGLTWQAGSSPHCSGTDTSCGVYPNCNNCNSYDGCSGNSYLNYYCSGTSCSYSSDSCTDCSCSCGGYNTAETTANGNCGDGKDNDCDGYTDSADSGCSSCSGTDTSCGVYPSCNNCNNNDGCNGDYYRNYYCYSNSYGCGYTSDSCTDCSCSCGGYNTAETTANGNCGDGKDNDCDGYTDSADSGCSSCSGTDTSCGTYPSCTNCNSDDGCSGNYYYNYYCVSNAAGCSHISDSCTDCSCSCGGYNTAETTANGNCGDGKDNDCDGYTDSSDSGCSSCSGTDTSCGVYPTCNNCNADDGCYGNFYRDYYCSGTSCSYNLNNCAADCSCSCGGYNTEETIANGNCDDGKDNDCDGYTDHGDSGCYSCDNMVKDGDETDIDCGGSCNPCEDWKSCIISSDCYSNLCDQSACKTPVLLIHGYLSKPATFNTLNSRLANDGFVVYNDFDYERITNNLANGNIKSYSHLLEGEINNIKSETGAVKVDIVANSMGGLIARWYSISHLDTIKNIVMLGTPNHGSHIANQAWILNLIGYYQTQYSKEEVDLILSGWSSIARTQLGVCSDFLKILNYGSDISYSLCESYDAFDHLNYYSNHNQDEIINERVTHSVIAAIINTRASNTWQWAVYRDYGDGIVNIHSAWLNKGSKTKVLNQNHGDLLEDSGTYGEIKNTLKNSNYHSSELVQSISEQSLSEELPQNLTGPENIQEFPELFGEIGNYETKTYSYNVSEVNLLEIIATLFSENMGVNIISPSGIAINKSSCNNDCNFSKENSVNIFDLLNPEDGTWQVEITYNNTGSHYYSLILLTQSNYSFYQVPTETSILPGDSVALKINFSQNNNHIAGSSVHVSINSSDYHYESALYDDGLHGDGLANDGIFTLNFTPPSLGDYYLEFIGSFERNGLTIKNAIYFTVTARTLVDLTANQLTFNSTYFFEGNNMTAIAEIENLAGYTAKNATIMLYSDDSLNNLLDNITIDFDPYEKKNVSFHWSNLTEGSYNLTVMISPFNEFMESNYSNNLLKKIIHIYTHGIILNEYSNLNLIFNSFGSKVVYIKIPQNKAISKAQFDVELKESQGTQSLTIKANEKSLTAINEYLDSNEDNTQKFSIPDYKDIPELNRELFDESNTDTIYYELNISDIQVNQNNNYSELNIDGFYYTQDNGKPILPIKYFEIPLPPEAETFNIEVVNPTYSEIDLGKKIKPFVLDYNLFRENSFKEDEVYGTYYSTPNLVTVNFGYKGEQKYALLKYYPFGYDSVKGKLNVTTHASLKLSYGNFQYLSNTVQSESIESTTESIPDVEWSKTFGGTGDDLADDVQQTNDGGYIISGYTGSGGFYGAYLIKTDPNGNIEWSKTFGGYDRAKSVQQTNDDGYIIAGYTDSFGAGNYDAYLIKIDPNGNIEWSKTFGGTGDDLADDVQQTNDGGYILSGVINYYNVWGGDSWLIKTDTNGNEQWNKTFGGSSKEEAYSVQQTNDSGYILGGDTYSFGNGDSDGYLVKTDSNGNMEWSKTFGINRPDRGYYDGFKSVQQTNDLGYILAGYTENTDGSDFYLVKTDINGNLEWNKTFSARLSWDEAKSVYQTNDDGYIVVGFAHSSISDNSDFFIVKTGPNGNYKWSKKFGGSGDDWANSAQQTSDGGYILAGYTDSFGAGNNDVYLVKLLSKSASIDILNDDNIEYAITLNQKITVNMSNLSNTYYNQDYDVLVPILISSNSAGIVEITNIDLEFKETKDYNYLLRRDWNLISSPIKSADNSIDYIFDLIDYSSILSFNNANNHWLFYKNESSNNFNTIDITKAYWLNSPLNQTLTIEGTEFTYPINFSLKEGWNLISYPSLNTTLINESLKEVNNTYASIMAYKDNNWLIYSPHKPTNLNTLTNLTPWQGYWIKVPRDINWTFDGTKFS